MKFLIILLYFSFLIFGLAGCAGVPYVMQPKPEGMSGIYHHVERNDTLWKIAQLYNVDLDEVVRINRISDATNIEAGQLIFIPGARRKVGPVKYSGLEDFIWPVKGRVINTFGQTFKNMLNKGINIQPYSTSDVVAAHSGRVVFSDQGFRGFGKILIIDHSNSFLTVYAGNSQVFTKVGDSVQKGDVIARIASNGQDKNAYLHFEIRKGHIAKNPNFYLSR